MSQLINMSDILPKRSQRKVGQMNRAGRVPFITNFYNVKLNHNVTTVYQYDAKFPEQIPGDSSELFRKCLYQIKGELRANLGYICHTGKVVFGSKNVQMSSTFACKINDNDIQVQIKKTKELKVLDLLENPKTRPSVFQFFNSKLKSCLRTANICELGKVGQFYEKDQLLRNIKKQMHHQYEDLASVGLNVLRGYKFTLTMINNRLLLQLDVCSRVLQRNNLQEDLQDFCGSKEEQIHHFVGATVITRYGNYRTHKIQEIDFSMSPSSTFQCRGTVITYAQYFKKAYNADIYDSKQPLLKVQSKAKRFIGKNQLMHEQIQYIYLVPELVSLTGMKDEQRANHHSMQALAPFTKLSPHQRFNESSKIISTLNQAKDTLSIQRQQQMEGFVLPLPKILFQQPAQVRNGAITNRGPLYEPHHFRNWVFVYSSGSQQDYNEACQIQMNLREASKAYSIRYETPVYVEVPANRRLQASDFCRQIQRACLQMSGKKIQLVFIILKPRETTLYGKIKEYLTNYLCLPCQCIQAKTLNKGKNIMSIASKIAIQMSCKAGAAPWIVENRIPYFQKKNYSSCSIASSKGKGGYTISFAGSTNNTCSKVYSNYALRVAKKQRIEPHILKHWFISWIKDYYMTMQALPEILMVYRESVGDSLMKVVLEYELQIFNSAIQDVKKKTKKPDYKPQVIYMIVNKRVNSRFFSDDNGYLVNPQPGSVVIDEMSVDDRFDFHLAAQKVNQGTCTPSQYIVGYDSSRMPQEDLIQFTYEQCYNYYNWQGSVKVPATLQCANKLSKLAGESIQKNFVESKSGINSTYFFL